MVSDDDKHDRGYNSAMENAAAAGGHQDIVNQMQDLIDSNQ